MTATDAPQRGIPMGSIDEDSIRALVHRFYGKVMADPDLAAIFGREIEKHEWPAHLDKMCAFWSSALLRSGRYDGRPLPPHLAIPDIEDRHFQRWLTLFAETARGALRPVIAEVLPLQDAATAHKMLEAGASFGKVVLKP